MALDTKQICGRKGFLSKTAHFAKGFLFKNIPHRYQRLTFSIVVIARALFTW